MLIELIRRGPDAGDNGPEWDAIVEDLWEAVDPLHSYTMELQDFIVQSWCILANSPGYIQNNKHDVSLVPENGHYVHMVLI